MAAARVECHEVKRDQHMARRETPHNKHYLLNPLPLFPSSPKQGRDREEALSQQGRDREEALSLNPPLNREEGKSKSDST